jgi:putative phosphoesterase
MDFGLRDTTAVVAVISDTDGLVRPEVLEALAAIAPVTAVCGKNDRGPWADALQATAAVKLERVWVYVVHDLAKLELDPRAAGCGAVVSGHSHRPSVTERDGVLYVNPGSAGPLPSPDRRRPAPNRCRPGRR